MEIRMSDEYTPPTPHPALAKLEFLVGEWRMQGRTVPGPMGPSVELQGTETFRWMEGNFFLIHSWEGRFGDGLDVGYEFFDYDPDKQQYRTHFFNSGGPYDEVDSHYAGDFEDDALVVIGPARFRRRPINADTIAYDCDAPDGEGGWSPFIEATLTRR
jgi:hypothetical protein